VNDNHVQPEYPERKLILVVEDSPTQALRLQALLENEYCYTLLAVDGEMGVRMAQQLLPNLILLDLQMPKLNGLEVCRELKSNTRTAGIPIILLSRYCEDEIGKLTQELGVLDCIPKNAMMERILMETLMQLGFFPSSSNKYPPQSADDHA
jgi:CheY-like chemotaxis protein